MDLKSNIKAYFCWLFAVIMLVTGILNLILVHPVPGIVYMLLSIFFSPPINLWIRKKLGFGIPFIAFVVFFLVIMWGTLAVGDLAEILGL